MVDYPLFSVSFYPYFLGVVALFLIWRSIVLVGGREIAVVERRYFGRKMPQGRVIALSNEIGIQARTLGPGLHFLIEPARIYRLHCGYNQYYDRLG